MGGKRVRGVRGWLAALCLLGALLGAAASAQNAFDGTPIRDIRVEGTQRIEPSTVRSYMQMAPGDPFSAELVDRALKNLFATGLFADVTMRREGNDLVVQVVENPIINRLAFEGNRFIDDDTLQAEVQLKPRVVYTQTRVQADTKRILDIYRRSGRFAATVEPKIIRLDQNRVDLVFEINEGETTKVRRIAFVGNKAFDDGELRGAILTKESAWYRFFGTADTYDPDKLNADKQALRNFYLSEGYADFRVSSAVAELSPDRDGFFISFTVDEGERYKIGAVDVKTSLRDLNVDQLRSLVTTETGDWYNSEEVDKTVSALTDAVGRLGFAFAQVEPRQERDRDKKVVNITYDIREGPRVYVERIDISGNVRTLDEVIRREFRLAEGDAFNSEKLQRTRQRIQNLGFFSKVDVQTLQGSAPDKVIIDVKVEEQSTGQLTFGAGFSTSEGPLGDVSIRERNLLGRGQDLRLDFTLSGRRSQLALSFTEPYFLDKPIAAGFDLFRTRTEFSESSYDETRTGGALRFGYDLSEFLRQTVKYALIDRDITNVDDGAARAIQEQKGETLSSVVSQILTYDRRDNRFDTRSGYYLSLSNDVAGAGGDVHYLRTELSGGWWTPLSDDFVLGLSGQAGYIFGLGEDVRISDAFFLGGTTLRGFRTAGIGPRDLDSDHNDALGGNVEAAGTVELSFPLGLPEEYPVRGRVFSDFGTLTDTDATGPGVVDEPSLRVSAGAGLTWKSPFGPIAVDLAWPILKESFDKEELFRISAGTRF
ncbi:MAG: outer membrane protein assembly factor BamA [Rhodospirillaceae bacterium]|nr:outer membrane protein assembly factor BamA [Rhodospirillaceae bacterium]